MLEKIGEADGDFTAAELGTKPSAFMDLVNTASSGALMTTPA